jgi:serine/threonine-protein kinase
MNSFHELWSIQDPEKILRELGRGSMGVVFQAHDPHIDRMVALKVLRQDRISSGAFVHRFMREARAIGRLSHPHIVTVYDIAESGGTAYISMEYIEGRPLDEVIKERDHSLLDILTLGITVAETLDYAHRRGIVHRDVKTQQYHPSAERSDHNHRFRHRPHGGI